MAFQTPQLIQQTAAASTVASPVASFTANFGANTTAGTTLVAVVYTANSGTAAVVSAPTGWPAGPVYGGAGGADDTTAISARVFAFPNNTGGFTAVAFTGMSNVNAISVSLFEFTGMPATTILDPSTSVRSEIFKLAVSNTARTISPPAYTVGNGLWIAVLACDALQTLTPANSPTSGIGTWVTGSSATSTTGTTNIKTSSFYSLPGPSFPAGGNFTAGLSIGAASFMGALIIDFLSIGSAGVSTIGTSPYGGLATGAGVGTAVGL